MATKTKLKKTKAAAANAGDVVVEEMNANEETGKQKIAPLVIPLSAGHEDLLPPVTGFQPHPGEYHIIALGPGGEELAGSDFSYPPGKSFNKAFANNPKFNVKKKPHRHALRSTAN